MRNLKRALSLVLATVMVIGMMVVGASAASYNDAADINFTEAVDVMTAVGMIEGYAGNFAPEATIDRAGAAKLIAYLNLGKDLADKLTVTEKPFNDVDVDAWYAGYVAYCKSEKLIEGYNGNFDPNGTISAYGFAKLLLGALGYKADIEGMTGDTWEVTTATLAIQNGLFAGNEGALGSEAMTREEAALYAFNALKAVCVGYTGGTDITVGDIVISGGYTRYEKTNTEAKDYRGEADGDEKLQLCEDLYGTDLKLNNDPDAYGRPGHTWTFGKDDEVVAFAGNKPYATYTGADFKQKVLNDLADKKGFDISEITYTWNTDEIANPEYECTSLLAGNIVGATVELYVSNKVVTDIVVIHPYITTIDSIEVDEDTDETIVTVHSLSWTDDDEDYTATISSKDNEDAYALIKDFDEGDMFAATFARTAFWGETEEDRTDRTEFDGDALIAVDEVETVSGKVTAKSADWIKIDGEKYTFANAYSGETVTVGAEGTFYLYNGYVMHYAEDMGADTSNNVAYVLDTKTDEAGWTTGDKTYYANLLFADGTTEVVETKAPATQFDLVTYSVKKDVYTLTPTGVKNDSPVELTKGISKLAEGVYANSKTTFVVMTFDGAKFDSAKVYTGVKNLPTMEAGFRAKMNEQNATMADYVFVWYVSSALIGSSDLVYVAGNSLSDEITEQVGEDTISYKTVNAVVDGKVVEIKVAADTAEDATGLYKTTEYDEDTGIYTLGEKAVSVDDELVMDETGFTKASNGVVKIGDETMTYVDDVPVYLDNKGTVSKVDVAAKSYSAATVHYTLKDGVVSSIYIVIAEA